MLSSSDRPSADTSSTPQTDAAPGEIPGFKEPSGVSPSRVNSFSTDSDDHAKLLAKLDSLRREDETLNNILAVDVWALAKTMDEFQPGFWSEFMKTRERALRRFMSEVVVKSKPTDLRRHPFLS
jgi:hypothetical protein